VNKPYQQTPLHSSGKAKVSTTTRLSMGNTLGKSCVKHGQLSVIEMKRNYHAVLPHVWSHTGSHTSFNTNSDKNWIVLQ